MGAIAATRRTAHLKFNFLRIAILATGVTVLACRCVAGLPRTEPTQTYFSADRTKILVLVSTLPEGEDENRILSVSTNGPTFDLRRITTNSGLFTFPDFKLIHPVPFRANYAFDIFPAADLSSFAVVHRYGAHAKATWGLRFYGKGAMVRSYSVKDLCSLPSPVSLPLESWGWYSRWTREIEVRDGDKLRLTTSERPFFRGRIVIPSIDEYLFDMSTGTIISKRSRGGWIIFITATLVAALVMIWWKSTRRRKRINEYQEHEA